MRPWFFVVLIDLLPGVGSSLLGEDPLALRTIDLATNSFGQAVRAIGACGIASALLQVCESRHVSTTCVASDEVVTARSRDRTVAIGNQEVD